MWFFLDCYKNKELTCYFPFHVLTEIGDNHNCLNMVSFHNGTVSEPVEEIEDRGYSLTKYPKNKSCFSQFTWILIWPIHLFFCAVIPNCRSKKNCKIYPLTFIMCIFWIGTLSYGVAWMITIIGKRVDLISEYFPKYIYSITQVTH